MKRQFRSPAVADAPPSSLEVRRTDHGLEVVLDGHSHQVEGGFIAPGVLQLRIDGQPVRAISASFGAERWVARGTDRAWLQRVETATGRRSSHSSGPESGELTAAMPGLVLKLAVAEGDQVTRGQSLLILEAMKMEHELRAPRDGRVKRITCTAGSMVSSGVPLIELEAIEPVS